MHERNAIVLDHLDCMTDSTGLIQHAIYSIPRRESGYTTDDNARALRLCARLCSQHVERRMLSRVTRYLSFIQFAQCADGGFHNFLSFQRNWLDAKGCDDCQGQAVRALAEVLTSKLPEGHRRLARELTDALLPTLIDLQSPRAQAYVVLAWEHLWRAEVADAAALENIAWFSARRLVECFERCKLPNWPWFEPRMTYANAVLPHALFAAARRWPVEPFLAVAESAFSFLDRETTAEGVFWPIGNGGWHAPAQSKALHDQQPVEAATMAEAAVTAFGLRKEDKYMATFRRAHDWFHGQNSARQSLADVRRGACCDGLHASGVNRNQGAESTLAYLWTELHDFEVQHAIDGSPGPVVASAQLP
ncbi:MAG: hypothetical protein WD063_20250 [Pirellulales bacterium]